MVFFVFYEKKIRALLRFIGFSEKGEAIGKTAN